MEGDRSEFSESNFLVKYESEITDDFTGVTGWLVYYRVPSVRGKRYRGLSQCVKWRGTTVGGAERRPREAWAGTG